MDEFIFLDRPHPAGMGGFQKIYKFPNGYGASLIQSPFSYGGDVGLFEIAVLKFSDGENYKITYETEVTEDVLGYLSENDCIEILNSIKELKEQSNVEQNP